MAIRGCHADLEEHVLAELGQRQLGVVILGQALQPVIPRIGARLAESVVDDEQLEIDPTGQIEREMLRPVVRPNW